MAAGLPNSNLGVPFLHYLRAMYGAGARGLFDTLAIHPYARSAEGMLRLTEQARAVMNRAGDEARLWITEFGWSTGGDASAFRVGATGQANRIALAVSGLAAERRALRLRGFVLFKWRDSTAPPGGVGRGDPWPLHTGLLAADAIPKPSFWTFARVVQSLASDTPASPGSAALTQISRRDVRLSPLGNAAVVLGCASAAVDACQGRLTLRSARPAGCGGAQLGRGARIGVARFRIGAPPALAPVPLSHASVALARCAGSLRVRASAAASRAVEFTLRAR